MKRARHDLPGVTGRIAKLANEFELEIHEASQVWKDSQGQSFLRQHTSDIKPTINQLSTGLTQVIELVDKIGAQLKDPDKD